MDWNCVAVPQEFHRANCVTGASLDAFPARGAFARIEFRVMYCFIHVLLLLFGSRQYSRVGIVIYFGKFYRSSFASEIKGEIKLDCYVGTAPAAMCF